MATDINAYDALYIPANDTPWFPYEQSGCDVQLVQADPMTGRWIVKSRGPAGGNLGIHRHYGSVLALTLHGAWRYLEHDWISRTGDIVHETPGSVHTLVLVGGSAGVSGHRRTDSRPRGLALHDSQVRGFLHKKGFRRRRHQPPADISSG